MAPGALPRRTVSVVGGHPRGINPPINVRMGEIILMQQPIRLDQLMRELLDHLETPTHPEAVADAAASFMTKEAR